MPAMFDVVDELPRHPTKRYDTRRLSDIKMVVVHTTDWDTTPQKLAEYDITPYFIVDGKKVYNHISRSGCPSITYHEGIMRDGTIYSTLDWGEVSWHVGKWNKQALGIALYYSTKQTVTFRMMDSLVERCMYACMVLRLTPDKVVGHRELEGTGWFWHKGSRKLRKTCPGMQVDMDSVREEVCKRMQFELGVLVDGHFGPKSRKALEDR